jgi:hypothetical protein
MPLYMVVETFKPGARDLVYERYNKQGRMMPAGLTYVNSWLEVDGERCFQIMTGESRALFDEWIRNWQDLVDFEIVEIEQSPTAKEE